MNDFVMVTRAFLCNVDEALQRHLDDHAPRQIPVHRADSDVLQAELRALLAAAPEPPAPGVTGWEVADGIAAGLELHASTANLVQRFARALAEKLAAAEHKYGYTDGWLSPEWMDECRAHLRQHVEKGDPRDVAAYCAFLWHHGESTAALQARPVGAGMGWPFVESPGEFTERLREAMQHFPLIGAVRHVLIENPPTLTTPPAASISAGEGEDAVAVARRFHETYERLAPQFGYETRAETRAFDPDSANGRLMIAVCAALTHPAGDAAGGEGKG